MNISEMIDDIKKRFGKKKEPRRQNPNLDEEDELDEETKRELRTEESEGSHSLVEGDHGKIYGLSKPVILGVGSLIFLIFFMATIFALSDGGDEDKNKPQPATPEKIADINSAKHNKDAQKMATDYEQALAQRNANKVTQPGQNPNGQDPNNPQNQNGNNGNTVQATPVQEPVVAQTVPQIPRSNVVRPVSYAQNYELPSQQSVAATPIPAQNSAANEDKNLADKVKEKLKSAIAFFNAEEKGGTNASTPTATAGNDSGGGAASGNVTNTVAAAPQTNMTYTAPQPNTVMAGTVIPVMLMTGINTDTPGQVMAQVMGDVYDIDGVNILIPAGSRILGATANSNSNAESGRVNVTFTTLVAPNGGSWNIGDAMVAIDGAGYTGINGKLHRHTGNNFMKGVFNSAMTALSTVAVDRVTLDASALTAVANSQKPTTTVAPGYQFNVYVTKNIRF